jgi:hypothetical protein
LFWQLLTLIDVVDVTDVTEEVALAIFNLNSLGLSHPTLEVIHVVDAVRDGAKRLKGDEKSLKWKQHKRETKKPNMRGKGKRALDV